MRQLKGKVKETRKQKKERREENAKIQQQIHSIVLPVLGAIVLLIGAYVFIKSRPSAATVLPDDFER